MRISKRLYVCTGQMIIFCSHIYLIFIHIKRIYVLIRLCQYGSIPVQYQKTIIIAHINRILRQKPITRTGTAAYMLIHLFVFKQPSVIFIHDIRILILTIIFACHTVFTYKSVFMILIPGAYTSFICIANTLIKSDISKNFAIFLIKSAHLHGRYLRIIRCQFI